MLHSNWWMVPGFLQTWHLAFRPKSSIFDSSNQRILFLMVWGLRCLQYSGFTIKAWLVECSRDGCPSGRFSHLRRGTLELCQSDHQVLGHLPEQGPSPPIDQFGQAASSRKSLGGSKLLPFKNDATVFFGTFNVAEMFGTLPQISASTQSCLFTDNSFHLMALFLLWHSLSTVGSYIDRPFQIMSNQLNFPQVDLNKVVETSQWWSMETGCTWAQFCVS